MKTVWVRGTDEPSGDRSVKRRIMGGNNNTRTGRLTGWQQNTKIFLRKWLSDKCIYPKFGNQMMYILCLMFKIFLYFFSN